MVSEPADMPTEERIPLDRAADVMLTVTDAQGQKWLSQQRIEPNSKGEISLLAGYQKTPAALFWNMIPSGSHSQATSFAASDQSLTYVIHCNGRHYQLSRVWGDEKLRVRQVEGNGFRGTIYLPRHASKAGVLILSGQADWIKAEPYAALLASHGFKAMVCSYSDDQGALDLELLASILKTFKQKSRAQRLALLAFSLETPAALTALSEGLLEVDCAAMVSPSDRIWQRLDLDRHRQESSCRLAADQLDYHPIHYQRLLPQRAKQRLPWNRSTPLSLLPAYQLNSKRETIAVERIEAPLALIAGGKDHFWPAATMAEAIASRRRLHHNDLLAIFPEAGHLFNPPLTPTTINQSEQLFFGGSADANARAQLSYWPQLLRFFSRHLNS